MRSYNRTKVLEQLQEIFDQVFITTVSVTEKLSAKDIEEWDSLTHISLLVAVENKFSIRFGLGEVEAVENVGEFADLIILHSNNK
jgi:acyl carrier protein